MNSQNYIQEVQKKAGTPDTETFNGSFIFFFLKGK